MLSPWSSLVKSDCLGVLGVLLRVLALADLGVPLGVCAVFETRLAVDFNGVGFALDAVAFLRIVRMRVAVGLGKGDLILVCGLTR